MDIWTQVAVLGCVALAVKGAVAWQKRRTIRQIEDLLNAKRFEMARNYISFPPPRPPGMPSLPPGIVTHEPMVNAYKRRLAAQKRHLRLVK